ncbi:tachylectin-2-like isoform X1 [Lepisosteus oculatus]|uniref:tachylectin-2-like isoform X1 n=1 Tax=Lepisosteus oculatus TaxID=7918 RepID=UPI00371C1366
MSDEVPSASAAKNTCPVLFGMESSGSAHMGLPPVDCNEVFHQHAKHIGNLQGFSHILFSPTGIMYAVRDADIYAGFPPVNPDEDWLTKAKCVGRGKWDQFHSLFFHPEGSLYAVSDDGELYKGPPPDNEEVSWLYKVAKMIGTVGWLFPSLFFDPEGILYAVTSEGKLVKGKPPTEMNCDWLNNAETLGSGGWPKLTHFIAFSHDGNLWCVSKDEGKMYSAPPPVQSSADGWLEKAQYLGSGYDRYEMLAFTQDKTINKILSLDFNVASAKIISQEPLTVGQHDCDNTAGTVPSTATLQFSEPLILESSFSHVYEFTVAAEASTTFKAGIPVVAENVTAVTLDVGTTYTWNFKETERKQVVDPSTLSILVPPGKAVRFKAFVQKRTLDVPYTAKVTTVFGYETTITGRWLGASVSRVGIKEEILDPKKEP